MSMGSWPNPANANGRTFVFADRRGTLTIFSTSAGDIFIYIYKYIYIYIYYIYIYCMIYIYDAKLIGKGISSSSKSRN